MTLTLLLLIFIFIAFFSVLTIIFVTVKKGSFPNGPTYNLLSFAFYFLQIGFYIYQLFMRYFPKRLVSSYSYPFGFSFVY